MNQNTTSDFLFLHRTFGNTVGDHLATLLFHTPLFVSVPTCFIYCFYFFFLDTVWILLPKHSLHTFLLISFPTCFINNFYLNTSILHSCNLRLSELRKVIETFKPFFLSRVAPVSCTNLTTLNQCTRGISRRPYRITRLDLTITGVFSSTTFSFLVFCFVKGFFFVIFASFNFIHHRSTTILILFVTNHTLMSIELIVTLIINHIFFEDGFFFHFLLRFVSRNIGWFSCSRLTLLSGILS